MFNYTDFNDIAIKLILSIILGGLIGLDRESHRRPAGLRTHMLVAVGSTILMHINIYLVTIYPNIDPGRFGAQVISGIGFLGAGTIMKEGPTIYGLTTAASLWTVAAIGLAVGSGHYILAILSTILILIVLKIFNYFEVKMKVKARISSIYLETTDSLNIIKKITEIFETHGFKIDSLSTDYTSDKGHLINVKINCKSDECNTLIDSLSQVPEILKIRLL
ncbi:MAG: MgtC/SapB family protein [Clostridiales bacterium]|nr:MgtC/SapB family protein [Clostridiales bacterium]